MAKHKYKKTDQTTAIWISHKFLELLNAEIYTVKQHSDGKMEYEVAKK